MADYTQTHVVPTEGLPAWNQPDGSGPPAASLDPGLDVQVTESRGGWAHIRCSNGWEAWVDGRRLVESQPAPAPAAPTPPPPTPPPQPAPTPAPSPAAPPPTQPVPQAAPPTQPSPPSAVWAAPRAAAGAPPRAGGGFRIGPGQIVALAGGLVFLVSSWLEWLHVSVSVGGQSFSQSYSAYEVPAHFLLDSESDQGGLNLGILIAFFGVACIAAALVSGLHRRLGILPIAAGGVSVVVVLLFMVQTKYAIDALPSAGAFERGYFSVLRYGAIFGLLGAIATLVGGILALVLKRS